MKLAVFDYDSTLMEGETLEFLAKEIGIEKEIKEITDRAMCGELDFFESLTQRVALLKGLPIKTVDEICKNLPYTKGAKETVTELKKMGYKVVCFSGGFKNATSKAKDLLGLDAEFSNMFHVRNEVLTGLVGGEMMFGISKGILIKSLQGVLGISKENTLVVGDGANDLSMFAHAGTKVAFCAKEVLRKEANVIISNRDLTEIISSVENS